MNQINKTYKLWLLSILVIKCFSIDSVSPTVKIELQSKPTVFLERGDYYFAGYLKGTSYQKAVLIKKSSGLVYSYFNDLPIKYAAYSQSLLFLAGFEAKLTILSISESRLVISQTLTISIGENELYLGSPTYIAGTTSILFGRVIPLSSTSTALYLNYTWRDREEIRSSSSQYLKTFEELKQSPVFKYDYTRKGELMFFKASTESTSALENYQSSDINVGLGIVVFAGGPVVQISSISDLSFVESINYKNEAISRLYSIKLTSQADLIAVGTDTKGLRILKNDKSMIHKWDFNSVSAYVYSLNINPNSYITLVTFKMKRTISFVDIKAEAYLAIHIFDSESSRIYQVDISLKLEFLVPGYGTEKGCVFDSPQSNNTPSCSLGCLTCDLDSNCLTCTPSTPFLESGSCLDSCSQGYYQSESSCLECSIGCEECSDNKTCTKCKATKFLESGSCLDSCSQGYYQSESSCLECSTGCEECSDNKTCTKCKAGSIYKLLQNQECVENCSINFYEVNQVCEQISSGSSELLSNKTYPESTHLDTSNETNPQSNFTNNSNETIDSSATLNEIRIFLKFIQTEDIPSHDNYDVAILLVPGVVNNRETSKLGLLRVRHLKDIRFEHKELGLITSKISKVKDKIFALLSFSEVPALYGQSAALSVTKSKSIARLAQFEESEVSFVLDDFNESLNIEIPNFSSERISEIALSSAYSGNIMSSTVTGLQVMLAVGALTSIDPSAEIIRTASFCRLISMLSLIDIHYGCILDPFFLQISIKFTKSNTHESDQITLIENGWKRRLSKANIALEFVRKIGIILSFYLISWFIKIILVPLRSNALINPSPCSKLTRVIYYHRKLHIVILNVIMTDGIVFLTRSLTQSHIRLNLLHYGLAILVIALLSIDILCLFNFYQLVWSHKIEGSLKRRLISKIIDIKDEIICASPRPTETLRDIRLTLTSRLPKKIPICCMEKKLASVIGYNLEFSIENSKKILQSNGAIAEFKLLKLSMNAQANKSHFIHQNIEPLTVLRMIFYQATVVLFTQAPGISLCIIYISELLYIGVIVRAIKHNWFNSKLHVIKRVFESIFLIGFLTLLCFIYTHQLIYGRILDTPGYLQTAGIYITYVGFALEILISITYLGPLIFKYCKRDNTGKLETAKPCMYYWRRSSNLEDSEDRKNLNTFKKLETYTFSRKKSNFNKDSNCKFKTKKSRRNRAIFPFQINQKYSKKISNVYGEGRD